MATQCEQRVHDLVACPGTPSRRRLKSLFQPSEPQIQLSNRSFLTEDKYRSISGKIE